MMARLLQLANESLFFYYLLSNLIYLALTVVAMHVNIRLHHSRESYRLDWIRTSPLAPPISILAPAHNEEKSIRASVRSLLSLDYPHLELIVINDGSADRTLEVLTREFALQPLNALYVRQVACARVRGMYQSASDPRLLVVDKEPGGSKADATNAGLNAATSPYVCVVDADSVLERDALLRIMVPVVTDPQRVVAAGGVVRVLNGSPVKAGQVETVRLPRKAVEIIQVIEYLRAFLIGREAWAHLNMLLIISGAFGVFRTDVVRAIGGFRSNAIGEDMDLVSRMHRYLRCEGKPYSIQFVSDPVCWTEVPSDLRSLGRQRARWQKGLMDVLWPARDMLFRKRYGRIGWVALPYYWIYELAAPVVELGGFVTIAAAAYWGVLSRTFFLKFLIFGYAFATAISLAAVLQEEFIHKRYNQWKDVAKLIAFCFLEHFPYRQMHMIWRLQGMWEYLRGDMVWKPLKRRGLEASGT